MPESEDERSEVLPAVNAKSEELPAMNPPQTRTPVSFNQQINNFQQIPPSAWDGLTPEQRLELTRTILIQMDSMDKRHYDFALHHIDTESRRGTTGAIVGGFVAVSGFVISGYLSLHNQTVVALSISTALATILAIIVGNRFVSRP